MTSYPGPWIQAPDYELADERCVEVPIPDTIPTDAHVELAEESSVGFDPYVPANYTAPIMHSHLAGREIISPTVGASEGGMLVEAHYSIEGPPFVNVRWGDVYRSWRVSTISAEHLGVRYWAPTPFVGITPPPGAIGYEWQDGSTANDSNKSQVVKLNADLEVGLSGVADSTEGAMSTPFVTAVQASSGHFLSDDAELGVPDTDQLQAWDGPSSLLPDLSDRDANPGLVALIGGPHYPVPDEFGNGNLHLPYDLTPFLDDRGRIVLSSYVTFDTERPANEATPIVPSDLTDPGEPRVAYGHSLIWHPVWTFRPPVFRWLYATPQITSAPPLRHTQRDDKHGPSPRNKPARTRQAGLRNTGYL